MRPSTARAYGDTWRAWSEYCARIGRLPEQLEPGLIAAWLEAQRDAGARATSLRRHLAGLRARGRQLGLAVGYGDQRIREALRPLEVAPVRQAAPLRREALLRVLELLATEAGPRALRDAALLSVGWAAALRPSPLGMLRWRDLSASDAGKTRCTLAIREDKGSSRVVGLRGLPVEALARWAAVVTVQSDRPIWAAIDRHGSIRPAEGLGPRDVTRIVVGRALEAGLTERYSGHSLRAGYATEAELAGVPRSAWMRQTGHRSEAVAASYVRDRAVWHAGTGLLPEHLPGLFGGHGEPPLQLVDGQVVPPGDQGEGPLPAER